MTARFLVNNVSSDPLIRADQTCRDLVDEAKDYLLLPQERLNMQGPRTRRRKPIKSSEVLLAGIYIYLRLDGFLKFYSMECLFFI